MLLRTHILYFGIKGTDLDVKVLAIFFSGVGFEASMSWAWSPVPFSGSIFAVDESADCRPGILSEGVFSGSIVLKRLSNFCDTDTKSKD